MRKLLVLSIITIAILTLINACRRPFDPFEANNSGHADFTKFVAIGGDYMAGYMDGALYAAGQENSVGNLLATQFIKYAKLDAFRQPTDSLQHGFGFNLGGSKPDFWTEFHLGNKTDCQNVTSLFPLNDSLFVNSSPAMQGNLAHILGFFQNESVPGARVTDYLDPSFSTNYYFFGRSPYFQRFAHIQGNSTMIGDALAQSPTFFALWPGMEDVYNYALRGGKNQTITDYAAFDAALDKALDTLTHFGAKGILANIPDISCYPFFTLIDPMGVVLNDSLATLLNSLSQNYYNYQVGANGFLISDSTQSPHPNRLMHTGEYVLLSVPTDSLKCNYLGVFDTIPGQYILDHFEIDNIKNAISHFNSKIASLGAKYNLPIVDMNSFFNRVKTGYMFNGIDFTSSFIEGGFFSLDGFHPNGRGYGLIANEFIRSINSFYKATIPEINISDLPGIIFP